MTPLAVMLISLVLAAASACSAAPQRPAVSAPPTPTSAASPTNMAAMGPAIDAAVAASSFDLQNLRALIVSINGSNVVERYYQSKPQEYADLQSVTKSVVSTLIGIAIGEGKIAGVDAKLAELLPQYRSVMDPRVARTTIRQLLTMTAGWGVPAVKLDRNLVKGWLQQGPESDPGEKFEYTNIGPHILAEVLARATGMSPLEYARKKLFDPLQIDTRPAYQGHILGNGEYWTVPAFQQAGFAWATAPNGVNAGPYGMKLRATDLLKIGQLYLDNGQWRGRQIVPAAWVRDATAQDSPNGYGYLWWIHPVDGHPGYAAQGSWGQVILVVPERKLVVVASSRPTAVDNAGARVFDLVDAAIAPYLG
jgi:CubicO group peptidase (beta-lactamase class C family)